MFYKKFLVITSLILMATFLTSCGKKEVKKPAFKPPETGPLDLEKNIVIQKAIKLYQERKLEGVDFSDGPCLSQDIYPNWVVDIAHFPRKAIDDKEENQCQAFLEGRARHFIELDPEGKFIRAK